MTVKELCSLSVKPLNLCDGDREISCGYAGDLLGFVMVSAPKNSVWFTVMTSVNVCGVAAATDCSAVIVCEGSVPTEDLFVSAKEHGVNLFTTELDVFSAIKEFVLRDGVLLKQ